MMETMMAAMKATKMVALMAATKEKMKAAQ
jgi:hypothetical protein